MELNGSTFVVEIVNFAVLVWLLNRFLYRPVTRAIAARQRAIDASLQQAEALRREGEENSKRYEARLSDWERDKAALREQFDRGLAEERARREAEMSAALQHEREQAEAAQRARERENEQRLAAAAGEEAARFAGRLLSRVASASLEHDLIAAVLDDLSALPDDRRALLLRSRDGRPEATVSTRFPVPDEQRAALAAALSACLGTAPDISYARDEALLAGVRIDLGTITLEGNLAGELRWFAEVEARAAS